LRKSRRQIVIRVVEAIGFGLVALNILLYFGVYRPLGNQIAAEEKHHRQLRHEVRDLQSRVDLLDKFQAGLPETGKQLEDFTKNRTPERRQGFSTAAHLIQKVADDSKVKTSSVGYHLDTTHDDPLERLGIDISVQGPYTGLLKFSHALETANDFMLIREFTITPLDSGSLDLHLNADLYLTR
jgi:Tfp pilus assembly protein PilO